MLGIILFLGLLTSTFLSAESKRCLDICQCYPSMKSVSCTNKGLRDLPFGVNQLGSTYEMIDLRDNLLTKIDLSSLSMFTRVNLKMNPFLDCQNMYKQAAYRSLHVMSDCKDNVSSVRSLPDVKTATQESPKQSDAVNYDANAYGEANVEGSGELKVTWNFSIGLTIIGVISGTASIYGFMKLKSEMSDLSKYMKRHEEGFGYEVPLNSSRKSIVSRLRDTWRVFTCCEKRRGYPGSGRNGSRRKNSPVRRGPVRLLPPLPTQNETSSTPLQSPQPGPSQPLITSRDTFTSTQDLALNNERSTQGKTPQPLTTSRDNFTSTQDLTLYYNINPRLSTRNRLRRAVSADF